MKSAVYAALALAFASFGDAFLYAFLPVNFLSVGVPVTWVGLLLSINRFIRIFSNTLLVEVIAKYGLRSVMGVGVILAILSTLGYAMASAIVTWLLLRVMWGLSFSALRIGTLAFALQQQRVGFALGLTRGLQESGPMLSLLLVPMLMMSFESRDIFMILALLSLPALYFVFSLPRNVGKPRQDDRVYVVRWPSKLNTITLVSAIVIDGILVIVLGVLFMRFRHEITPLAATSLAALYLGYRRVCLVMLSPGGGWIADKIGLDRLFSISIAFVVLGLIMILTGWIASGAIVVFTFYSVNAAITPGSVSQHSVQSLTSVAENATWRDIGAAVGTLCGGFLISSPHLEVVLTCLVLVLTFLVLIHFDSSNRFIKLLYLWK